MTRFGEAKSTTIENKNVEIEARLISRARRRARCGEIRNTSIEPQPLDRRGANGQASTSSHSFTELSRVAQNVPLPSRAPEFADPSPTVENLIAGLIHRPLNMWLHDNLTPMVERIVQDEVHAQSREWLDENLPPILERLARETLRNMFSQAARKNVT